MIQTPLLASDADIPHSAFTYAFPATEESTQSAAVCIKGLEQNTVARRELVDVFITN